MSIPTMQQIESIPVAAVGEFELSDKETQTLRSRIYAVNKAGVYRYRTLREAPLTLVWKLRK